MKKLLTCLYCLIVFGAHAQEKLNTFHVVDSATLQPVPTSVTIIRAKLAITTEKDGIFIIPGHLDKMRDTVIFNTQNYDLLKMPLSNLNGMDTIKLSKIIIKNFTSDLSYKDNTLLNNFNKKYVVHYAGIHTENGMFNYLQLAQQFKVSKVGVRLKTVKIVRLAYGTFGSEEQTKYRLRIYNKNPATGGPGKDLYDKIIEVKSKDQNQSTVNLKKLKIVIPDKAFFIAIEWVRDFYNMSYSRYYDDKLHTYVQFVCYRPAIGLSPITGTNNNIWALNLQNQWKPYNYFAPFGTDLAIRVSVDY